MITLLLCKNGNVSKGELRDIGKIPLEPDTTFWVDFEKPTEDEITILAINFGFHPLAIEDCTSPGGHFPKIEDYGDHIFLIMHAIDFSISKDEFDTLEINFFVGKNFIVTFHKRGLRCITYLQERCFRNNQTISRGVGFLLYELLDAIIDDYAPSISRFDTLTEALEDEALKDPTNKTLEKIFDLKADIQHLRRISIPEREILNRLVKKEFSVIDSSVQPYFRDVYDHLWRIADLADYYNQMTSGARDAYLATVSNRLNEVMKVLTVIATIMMPLTVITGIYGTNFEVLPELKHPYGYYIMLAVMALIAITMLIYFKRKKWI